MIVRRVEYFRLTNPMLTTREEETALWAVRWASINDLPQLRPREGRHGRREPGLTEVYGIQEVEIKARVIG